ncbi:NAD(P)H-dependent oxidoreductase [Alsobacter sp. R-9]
MARRILIIDGHPDPDRGRLIHAMAGAYEASARAAGHEIRTLELASADIPLLRSKAEFETMAPPADIARAQEDIRWAEHVVLLFPLWMGGAPALVKAFLEQTLRPGFAARTRGSGMPEKLLAGRSVRIVITMGMPVLAYRWWFGAHGLRSLKREILALSGLGPISDSLFGGVEQASAETRQSWLAELWDLGRTGG